MTTEHNLEVAIRLGIEHGVIDSPRESNVMATARFTSFIDAYTARILAKKAIAIEAIDAELLSAQAEKIVSITQQLSEALARNAMQQEALKEITTFPRYRMPSVIAKEVLSASAESVAAWEAEKLLPFIQGEQEAMALVLSHEGKIDSLQRQVASNRALLEELNNFKAILPIGAALRLTSAIHFTEKISEAYDKQHAAEVLEDFKNQHPTDSNGCFIHSGCLDSAIAQLRAEAQKASPESGIAQAQRFR